MSRRGLQFSIEAARQHAAKHGYAIPGVTTADSAPDASTGRTARLRGRREPNKTEAEYGRILESQKTRGEILDYKFEGITLKWGDGMRYTPDYVVTVRHVHCNATDADGTQVRLIEVKGGHIWSRDMVRFRGCRAEWKDVFDFEMHQKKKGNWERLQ